MRALVTAAALSLATAAFGADAHAAELVPGGAAFAGEAPAALAKGPRADERDSRLVAIKFTPRSLLGSNGVPSIAQGEQATQITIDVDSNVSVATRLDRLSLSAPSAAGERQEPAPGLVLGGALHFSDWQIGGHYAQTSVHGDPTDLLGAEVGFGAFSAGVSFGQLDEGEDAGSDLWIVSTDLAAWSWLSLEGDVAVQTSEETERETVGRVGLKLRF